MKYIIYFFIFFAFSSSLMAQKRMERQREPRQKLEQLEKIKLIEVLQMDEETTLRFFARRSEHENKIEEFRRKQKEILKKINESIENNSIKEDSYYKNLNNEFLDYEKKISGEKNNYIQSLTDILSNEQISKLINFHDRWMNDVRNLLIEQRFRRHN